MIYLRRFGLFSLIVIGITLVLTLMGLLTKSINENFGSWGLIGLVIAIVLVFAIADVQLDKYIKRKVRKTFDDLRKDSKYMFGGKDD